MERDAPGRLFHHAGRHPVAGLSRLEELPHVEGRLEHRLLARRELGGELREHSRAGVDVIGSTVPDGIELPGVAVVAAVQLPVEHHRRA